jgi:hypothetical protein
MRCIPNRDRRSRHRETLLFYKGLPEYGLGRRPGGAGTAGSQGSIWANQAVSSAVTAGPRESRAVPCRRALFLGLPLCRSQTADSWGVTPDLTSHSPSGNDDCVLRQLDRTHRATSPLKIKVTLLPDRARRLVLDLQCFPSLLKSITKAFACRSRSSPRG